MAQSPFLRIGTRGSALALAQTHQVRGLLARAHGVGEDAIAVEVIRTSGDAIQDRPLSEAGGKGLFTKEIDLAQLAGRIDIAVHSAKDLPTILPDGLVIAGYLRREDVRDALVAPRHGTLERLPQGARIGTVSLRRQAMLRRLRPDLRIDPLRGNVGTRLARVQSGDFDALVLAAAGLNRLGLAAAMTEFLDPARFIPAVGQGAIALVARAGDSRALPALAAIADPGTGIELAAERAFLRVLDGSCRTPIGGNARFDGVTVRFHGIALTPDGRSAAEADGASAPEEAEALGRRLGETVKSALPPGFPGA